MARMSEKELLELSLRVARMSRMMLRRTEEAEDAAQGVMVRAIRDAWEAPVSGRKIRWAIVDEIRKMRRAQMERLEEGSVAAPEKEDEEKRRDDAERLEMMMAEVKLSRLEGRVIFLVFYKGMSKLATAAEMGVGMGVVDDALETAKERLREAAWKIEIKKESRDE